jgi:hypothetical protein
MPITKNINYSGHPVLKLRIKEILLASTINGYTALRIVNCFFNYT